MPSWAKIGARPTKSVTLTSSDQVIHAGRCYYCGGSVRATTAATITIYDCATLPPTGEVLGTTTLNPAGLASISVSFDRPRQALIGIAVAVTGTVVGALEFFTLEGD